MAGVQPLTALQIGKEAVAGTAVATTREMYPDGTGFIDPGYGFSFHEGAQRGTYSNITHVTKMVEAPAISYTSDSTHGVTYDEIIIPFSQLIGGVTAVDADPIFTYTFTPAQTSHTFDTFTIHAGDATANFIIDYCVATGFTLSGGYDDLTQLSMDLVGQQIVQGAATAVAANNSAKIPSALWIPKYAATQAALGAAGALTNTLRSWTLDVDTGLRPRFYADGTYGPGQVVASGNLGGTLTMVWDSAAAALAQYDLMVAGTPSFIQLKASGSANLDVEIDMCVIWESVTPISSESDGSNEYELVGRLAYDATWTNSITAVVINTLAAMP
jgi:hypothetical protein